MVWLWLIQVPWMMDLCNVSYKSQLCRTAQRMLYRLLGNNANSVNASLKPAKLLASLAQLPTLRTDVTLSKAWRIWKNTFHGTSHELRKGCNGLRIEVEEPWLLWTHHEAAWPVYLFSVDKISCDIRWHGASAENIHEILHVLSHATYCRINKYHHDQ